MPEFVPLSAERDHARVLDLCHRAADYVRLETREDPDGKFVRNTLSDAPPALGPDDIFALGIERPDGRLAGIVTYLRNFYERDEWYMGLLMLDAADRGHGLGRIAAEHVIAHARADGGTLIRIAVLDANPRGRKFWESVGFVEERAVPADKNADGHGRHVLKLTL